MGAGGIKVRPNGLPKDTPVKTTLRQIGESINEVAEFGEGYGVEVRVEVHGHGTSEIPLFAQIMDVANHSNAKVCWNSNRSDSDPPGLAANFASLAARLGTVHIHDLASNYPWQSLFDLLKHADFEGWTLVEGENKVADPLEAMKRCKTLWDKLAAA